VFRNPVSYAVLHANLGNPIFVSAVVGTKFAFVAQPIHRGCSKEIILQRAAVASFTKHGKT
jgi:hypothetical protein